MTKLKAMSETDFLECAKARLSIVGNDLDGALSGFVSDVLVFLRDAGADETALMSSAATGVVCRGVTDMYYGASDGKFSEYFNMLCTQFLLKYKKE